MANYLTTDTDLEAVADAIRTKGGTSAQLEFPQGFVDAIDTISSGGVTPTGTLQITANGTFDVTQYASAEVNVAGGGVTVTPLSITENGAYTAPSGTAYSPVTVNVQGSGSNSITIDVASFRSYDTANTFVTDIAGRIGVTYFVFEATFNNNTNNSRAGVWVGGVTSSYGTGGRVKRVGASGDFSYGVDVYAGSSITINYATID